MQEEHPKETEKIYGWRNTEENWRQIFQQKKGAVCRGTIGAPCSHKKMLPEAAVN